MYTEIYLDNANAVNTKPVRFYIEDALPVDEYENEPIKAIKELEPDCENRWQDDRHIKYRIFEVNTTDEFGDDCFYYIAVKRDERVRISLDNGLSFMTFDEFMECPDSERLLGVDWDILVHYMDDETCEFVHNEIAPCSNERFLERYLEVAGYDLVIG